MTDSLLDETTDRPAIPSGTVTLLFTDIEGSTRLLERLREHYAAVVAEHDAILRAALAPWHGHEIRVQGDSFVAFRRAAAYVAQVQRTLSVHEWPPEATVRVRIGLHTGEPAVARADYEGLDVHLAARISSAGHGGQVLRQQDRLAAVGQLAAGIAHDSNNILTDMIGLAQLLQMNPQMPATAKGDLDRIAQEGQRAARLIRQMLDFSRRSVPAKMLLGLAPLLKEMVKFLERTISEHVRVRLEIEPGNYTINADPASIQQAVTNLAVSCGCGCPHSRLRLGARQP